MPPFRDLLIMRALRHIILSRGIASEDLTPGTDGSSGLNHLSPAKFRETFRDMRENHKEQHLVLIVDEALREPSLGFLKENAPTLLNAAHSEGLRFLFVSAGFQPELAQNAEWRELFGRTRAYYLTNLEARPLDIPYIVAARFFEQRSNLKRLEIDGAFLLAVTDLALITPEARVVCDLVDEVLRNHPFDSTVADVGLHHLPHPSQNQQWLKLKGQFDKYKFRR